MAPSNSKRESGCFGWILCGGCSVRVPTAILALGQSKGIVKGRAEIRAYFEMVYSKISRSANQWYRTGTYFSDGHQLVWEYPRETPDGEQADILEVMEIKDGFITHHRVYWGWHGLQSLLAERG